MESAYFALRTRVWELVEAAREGDRASLAVDYSIMGLILLNILAVVLESVRDLGEGLTGFLAGFETFSVAVFTAEFLARAWSCVSSPKYANAGGRLRFALTPMALIDLIAILPFYLNFIGLDMRFLRVLRLFRIVRIAKFARYSASLQLFGRVLTSRKEELALSFSFMAAILVMASCLVYFLENPAQPEAYPDIPATMWWAVVTFTTIGYGDVFPVTPLGKVVTSVFSILAIGMFALPAGIIGSGFIEEIQKRGRPASKCPHCGGDLPDR